MIKGEKNIDTFEKNVTGIHGNEGVKWLGRLNQRVSLLAHEWRLSELKPYNNLTFNYTLSGYQNDLPIVLKLSLDESSLKQEVAALTAFSGFGAVAVLNYKQDAVLLQRAVPGTSLKGHPQAIQVACNLIKNLHQAPLPKTHNFPSIAEWLRILDQSWNLPIALLEKARRLKKQLLQRSYPQVILHGDLHRGNILSQDKEWLIIDPKGVVGFSVNEIWACIEDLDCDLQYISNFFGYSISEVVQWYFVHCLLAACWQLEDNLDPSKFLQLAQSVETRI